MSHATGPNEVWVISHDSAIWRYAQGQWQNVVPPQRQTLNSIDMLSPTEGWAVGKTIFHAHNGVWQDLGSPTTLPLLRVRMWSPDLGWAVGGVGQGRGSAILRYQGGRWQVMPSPTRLALRDVAPVAPDVAWAVGGDLVPLPLDCPTTHVYGTQNIVLHYTGEQWSTITAPTDAELHGIALSSPDTGWIVGSGTLLRYQDGIWRAVPTPQ